MLHLIRLKHLTLVTCSQEAGVLQLDMELYGRVVCYV